MTSTPSSRLRLAALLAASALSAPLSFGGLVSFNLNSLSDGPVEGQQGWTSSLYSDPLLTAAPGSGANTSQAFFAPPTLDGYGAAQGSHAITPGLLTGNETDAFLQFDFQRTGSDQPGNGSAIRWGVDANTNGSLGFNESASMRFQDDRFSFDTFYNNGPAAQRATLGAGGYTDWYSVRLVLNFQTGQGALYYKNLTRGDADYSYVTGGSLEMGSLAEGAQPAQWNLLTVNVPAGSYMDNIILGSSLSELANIPEPSAAAALLGLGAACAALGIRRRARA